MKLLQTKFNGDDQEIDWFSHKKIASTSHDMSNNYLARLDALEKSEFTHVQDSDWLQSCITRLEAARDRFPAGLLEVQLLHRQT